ncbi:hypothetical protein AMAG_15482 [Allomyces macrogynus ATCC 38327]|uniref:Uncharacterized protein n=1 Tax=Allomyces macrogynus (strain ATCC 38327) TaxID=578462 RepID=A0A0L0T7Q8_ALLM3|nr:hypothetical protein AMAG_15482 [Allomyces macrogynus ATCC 38327]|eukprot:KNE70731.1 hypothetical protein AMAG_15482 [Allomyces macrogynus ATCC 38327]
MDKTQSSRGWRRISSPWSAPSRRRLPSCSLPSTRCSSSSQVLAAAWLLVAAILSNHAAAMTYDGDLFVLGTLEAATAMARFAFLPRGIMTASLTQMRSADSMTYLSINRPDLLAALRVGMTYSHAVHFFMCPSHAVTATSTSATVPWIQYGTTTSPADDFPGSVFDDTVLPLLSAPMSGTTCDDRVQFLRSFPGCRVRRVFQKSFLVIDTGNSTAFATAAQPAVEQSPKFVSELGWGDPLASRGDGTPTPIPTPPSAAATARRVPLAKSVGVDMHSLGVVTMPVQPGDADERDMVWTVPDAGLYLMGTIKCGGIGNSSHFRVAGLIELSTKNQLATPPAFNPFFDAFDTATTHLSAGMIPLLTAYPILTALYMVLFAAVLAHFSYAWWIEQSWRPDQPALTRLLHSLFTRRPRRVRDSPDTLADVRPLFPTIPTIRHPHDRPLGVTGPQWALVAVVGSRLAWVALNTLAWTVVSDEGLLLTGIEVARAFILAAAMVMGLTVPMVMVTKGYGVTRAHGFAGVEVRTGLGLVMFLAIAEVFWALVYGTAILGPLLFYPTLAVYLAWAARAHDVQVTAYLRDLAAADADPRVVKAYEAKQEVLKQYARVLQVTLWGVLVSKVALMVAYPMHSWIPIVAEEGLVLGYVAFTSFLFRVRKPMRIRVD